MKITDVKYVDIVSTSESENGVYEMITSYKRVGDNKYLRTYSATDKYNTICKFCGEWNPSEDHDCEKEYVNNIDIIEEINDLQSDDDIRIYINKILI